MFILVYIHAFVKRKINYLQLDRRTIRPAITGSNSQAGTAQYQFFGFPSF
jgi:hypothetical protein